MDITSILQTAPQKVTFLVPLDGEQLTKVLAFFAFAMADPIATNVLFLIVTNYSIDTKKNGVSHFPVLQIY